MNNVYGTATIPLNTPTIIVGVTVPARSAYSLKGLLIWSQVDCTVEVRLNGATIGGGYISAAIQTLLLDYTASPYYLKAQDIVVVLATADNILTPAGSYPVSSTLLVEQL